MLYTIKRQHEIDERLFLLVDEKNNSFWVDFYTDGKIDPPVEVDNTVESWRKWLGSFIGKTIEIEEIVPNTYFSSGDTKIL